MFKKKNLLGFTLIELLIVIAIISTLATVMTILINPAEMARGSRDSRRISDITTLRHAIDLAMADDQDLLTSGGVVNINSSTSIINFAGSGLNLSRYLPVVPQDPSYKPAGGNIQIISTSCSKGTISQNVISYQFWSDGDTYILRANLESLSNCTLVENDGNNNSTYETGTEPGLNAI